MSTTLLERCAVHVASYCGPVGTDEHTRMRLQLGDRSGDSGDITLGFSDAVELHRVLGEWICEHAPRTIADADDDEGNLPPCGAV